MLKVKSVDDTSSGGVIVDVETQLTNGLPTMQIIGFVGKSLDEAKERIRGAFTSSNLNFPRKRIVCNISPSDIPKNGAHYDLAIALSILLTSEQIKHFHENWLVVGELGLDGSIKPVRGVLGKILKGKESGFNHFILPHANLQQSNVIPDIHVVGYKSLKDLYTSLHGGSLEFIPTGEGSFIEQDERVNSGIDIAEIVGQAVAKRAMEIAAAGQHNILLSGPPGVGKSMLAKALISLMPPLSRTETIEVTHLHSMVGNDPSVLIANRPFRSPHHTSSDIALIGGGQTSRPGEISLSHRGVLFLDELPEFRRSTLESLRQPLEDKRVTISRAKERQTYPADFLLVATKNPCPCGYYGSSRPCICSPMELDRYQKKLSGPLLDRIDLHITVDKIEHSSLLSNRPDSTSSSDVRERIISALKVQERRFKDTETRNGRMSNSQIKNLAKLSTEAKELLDQAAKKMDLSARVYMKVVKVARTIADLERSEKVEKRHIAEALRYRPLSTS